MRILKILSVVLAFAVTLTGCTAGTNIAVVNPTRLFQESGSGKAGFEHLKKIETSMQEQLQIAQKMIEEKPGDESLRMRVQQEFAGYQQLVNSEQQKVVDGINSQIKTSLEVVRQKKKIDAIFSNEAGLSFDDRIDVTADVLTEMDRAPLLFPDADITPIKKALTPEKPTAPAAQK